MLLDIPLTKEEWQQISDCLYVLAASEHSAKTIVEMIDSANEVIDKSYGMNNISDKSPNLVKTMTKNL